MDQIEENLILGKKIYKIQYFCSAPGVSVVSSVPGGRYSTMSGTRFVFQ